MRNAATMLIISYLPHYYSSCASPFTEFTLPTKQVWCHPATLGTYEEAAQ